MSLRSSNLLASAVVILSLGCSVLVELPDKHSSDGSTDGEDVSADTLTDAGDSTDADTECPPVVSEPIAVTTGGVLGVSSTKGSLAWSGSAFGLVWADLRDDTTEEAYFALLDGYGNVSRETRLTNAPEQSKWPSVDWNGSEFGVVWTDRRNGLSGDIYFTRVSATGVEIGDEVGVVVEDDSQAFAQLAWSGSEYGLSWYFSPTGIADFVVYFGRMSVDGSLLSSSQISSTSWVNPRIAWSGSEYGVVYYGHSATVGVQMGRISVDGSLDGSLIEISSEASGSIPSIAMGEDDFVVGWSNSLSIAVLQAPSTSEILWTVAGNSPSSVWADGQYGIVWESDGNVFFVELESSTGHVSDPLPVSDDGISYAPSIVWTGSRYGVVWAQIDSEGSGDLRFAIISPCGVTSDDCMEFPKWCFDADMDGYGRDDVFACADSAPGGYVETCGDCCDGDDNVNPMHTNFHIVPYECPDASYDYNCDGILEKQFETLIDEWTESILGANYCSSISSESACAEAEEGWSTLVPECGERGVAVVCMWNASSSQCYNYAEAWESPVYVVCR